MQFALDSKCNINIYIVCSQVQLLVTSQDVENYKQIKSDLDQLRSIVEKSELWVYKRQGSDEGVDAGDGLLADTEHKHVQYFVHQKTEKILFPVKIYAIVRPFCLVYSVGGFRRHR